MTTEIDSRLERLRLTPSDRTLFRTLVRDLRQTNQTELLAEVFELHADVAEADEATRLWLTVGDVLRRQDPSARRQALARAIDRARSSASLLAAMEQVLDARGETDALALVLESMCQHAATARARATAGARLARLSSDPTKQALGWAAVASNDPDRLGEAAGALEELGIRTGDAAILSRAEDAARQAGDTGALLRILEERLRRADLRRPGALVPLWLEAAQLAWINGRDEWRSLKHLQTAFERSPSDATGILVAVREISAALEPAPQPWLTLERNLSSQLGDWERVATLATSEAALEADPRRRAVLLVEAGDVLATRLGRVQDALPRYTEASELSPDLAAVVEARLAELGGNSPAGGGDDLLLARRRLLERAEDWAGVHALLQAQVGRTTGTALAALHLELAQLEFEKLAQPQLALASYQRVLALSSADGGAPDAMHDGATYGLLRLLDDPELGADAAAVLEDVLTRAGRWKDLIRAWRTRLHDPRSPEEALNAHLRIGQIQEQHLGNLQDAAGHFEAAAALRPGDASLYDAARRCRLALGDFEGALRLINREYRETHDPQQRAALDRLRADVLMQSGAPAWMAVEALYSALEDSEDETLTHALGDLLATADAQDGLRELTARWAEAGDATRAHDLAWTAGTTLGAEDDHGREFLLLAARLAPLSVPRLAALRDALQTAGSAEQRLEMWRLLGDQAPQTAQRNAARQHVARTLAELERIPEAQTEWARLIEQAPEDDTNHLGLLTLLRTAGEAAAFVAALDHALEATTLDETVAVELLATAAAWYDDPLGRSDLAVATWRRLLQLEPLHAPALEAIREQVEALEDFALWYDVLAEGRALLTEAGDIEARELALARTAAGELQEPLRAAAHQMAVARASTLETAVRLEAADALVQTLLQTDDDTALAQATALLSMLTGGEDGAARAEAVVDELAAVGRLRSAWEVATLAAQVDAVPTGWLHDRAAQLALRLGRRTDATRHLQQWRQQHASALPLDRRATLAALLAASDATADVALTLDVLCTDPDQPDLVAALQPTSAPTTLRAVCDTLATLEGDTELVLAARLRAASWEYAMPDGTAAAVALWREVLALAPLHGEAFRALEAHGRRHDDVGFLRELFEARLAAIEAASAAAQDEARVDTLDTDRVRMLRAIALLAGTDEEKEASLRAVIETDLSDLDARHTLAALLRKQERWGDLAELLEEVAELETDDEARLRALHTVARLAHHQLEDRARAAAVYERVLTLSPDDDATLERIEKLYRGLEDYAGLARALERRAALAKDDDRRIELNKQLARIQEQRLADRAAAVVTLEKIVAIEPANLPVLEDLARLNAEQEDWSAQVRALERMANNTTIRDLQAEIFVSAARTLTERLDKHKEAVELLATAFEVIHPDEEQLQLLRSAATAAELWIPLANVLRMVSLKTNDATQQEALETEIATVMDERAEDGEAAVAWMLERFALRPNPGLLLDTLEAVATRREMRTHLVEAYKQLAAAHSDDDEIWWRGMFGTATIAEVDVKRPDVAFDILATIAERAPLRGRAEAEMERIAREHTLWDKRRAWLESRLERGGDDTVARALEKARVEETELGDWEAAFETLVGAFQDDPDATLVREEMYRLAREHDAWDFVLRLYEALLDGAPEAQRVAWLLETARLSEVELSRPDLAFTRQLRAWQIRPRDAALRDGVEARATAAGRRIDLLAAWEWDARRSELLDEKRPALARVVDLAVELGAWERAVTAWRSLMSLPGLTVEMLEAADATLTANGQRPLLFDAVVAALESVRERGARTTLLVRLAELGIEDDRVEEARDVLVAALGELGRNPDVRRELARLHRQLAAWKPLVETLERLVEETPDADEKVALHDELYRVRMEELSDADAATAGLKQAMRTSPDPEAARQRYAEHLRTLERWDDLVEFHMDRAAAPGNPDSRHHSLQAASVADEFLADPGRALRIADGLLKQDAGDLDALQIRARALASLGRWTDHIETLTRTAARCQGRAAAQAYAQAAEAYELQLFDSARAATAWAEAQSLDPRWMRPHAERARLLEEAQDLDGAIAAQRLAVTAVGEGEATSREASDAQVTLARLLGQQDAEGHSAEIGALLEAAVLADPRSADARRAYEEHLEASGGLERLMILLDEEFQRAVDDEARALVLCKRAVVFAFEANRESDARKALERAQQLAPTSLAPLAVLGDLHFAAQRWAEAETQYTRLIGERETLPAGRLLAPRKLIVGETPEGDLTVLYRTRHAVALEKLGRLDEAYEGYATANLDDPTAAPALAALARLSVLRGNLAGAAVHVQNFLENVEGAPREMVAEMKILAARIAESEGNTRRAVQLYDEAAALGAVMRRDVVERAAQAAMRSGNWESVVPRLQKLVEMAETTEDRAAALLQLAEVMAREPGHDDDVVRYLVQAVGLSADRSPNIPRAMEMAQEFAHGAQLQQVYQEMLAAVDEPQNRATLLVGLGQLRLATTGRMTKEVAEAYSEALQHAPDHVEALERMVGAWTALDDMTSAVRTLRNVLDAVPAEAVGTRTPLLRALADLQFNRLEDMAGARATLEALQSYDPDDVRTLELLLQVYESDEVADDEAAMVVATALVAHGSLSADLLRSLQHLHHAAGNIDAVVQVLKVLAAGGETEPAEDAVLSSLPVLTPNLAQATPEALAPYLLGTGFDREAARVLEAATATWLKNLGHSVRAPGQAVDALHPAAITFLQLRGAFGAGNARLHVDEDQVAPVRVVPTQPVTLVLSPETLALTDETTLRFELGRALAQTQPAFLLVDTLGAFELLGFVEAALEPLCIGERRLDDSLRKQLLRWKERLAGYHAPAGVSPRAREAWPSAAAWRTACEEVSARAGLVAAGDVAGVVERLLALAEVSSPEQMSDLQAACEENDALRAVVAFALSETWLRARGLVGVARA